MPLFIDKVTNDKERVILSDLLQWKYSRTLDL